MEKNAGMEREQIVRSCIAGLGGVVMLLLLTLLCALLSAHVPAMQGREGLFGRLVLLLASFCAARMASGKGGGQRLPCAAVSGGVLLVFLLVVAIVSTNSSVLNISLLLDLLCIISGGFLACILRGRGQRRRRKNR